MFDSLIRFPRLRFFAIMVFLWPWAADGKGRVSGLAPLELRKMCFDDRAAFHIVHIAKTEWIFSGVRQDDKGYFSDIGIIRSAGKLNREQAIRYTVKNFPRATIKHIDDRNKIITYAVSG